MSLYWNMGGGVSWVYWSVPYRGKLRSNYAKNPHEKSCKISHNRVLHIYNIHLQSEFLTVQTV